MAANDTIADMLTRIRNANLARHQTVDIPSTKMTRSIAQVLKEEGFIADFTETGEDIRRHLVVTLKYRGKSRDPIIKNLKRVSRPGLRVYSNRKELPRVLGGIGIAIISHPPAAS
jgi:small subunit ribosomal protein S8